jgi:predicted nucleic acid-binding protein
MNNTFVILDSSALIAQINLKDIWHKKADETAEFIAQTDREVILPYEVFAETLNRIGNNIGRQETYLADKALLARDATGDIQLNQSNPGLLAVSLELLKTVKETQDKRASLRSLALMRYSFRMATIYPEKP